MVVSSELMRGCVIRGKIIVSTVYFSLDTMDYA